MAKFSFISQERLNTCDEKLQQLFREVIKHYDCAIIDGYRNERRQNEYYHEGRSQLKFPHSKHNKSPSVAVDVAPFPIKWGDKERFYHFAGFVKGVASQLGIKLIWGGDWDSDKNFHDQNFYDLPHFELKE